MEEINSVIGDELSAAWEAEENANKKPQIDALYDLELTEEQLNQTNNSYKIKDALAFYRHVTLLVRMYYNARFGVSMAGVVGGDFQEDDTLDYDFTLESNINEN